MMVAAHTLGWWLDWEAAQSHNHARTSTREVIEARVKLECEREQQEQLLLSVIPAYIAAEVSVVMASISAVTVQHGCRWGKPRG